MLLSVTNEVYYVTDITSHVYVPNFLSVPFAAVDCEASAYICVCIVLLRLPHLFRKISHTSGALLV